MFIYHFHRIIRHRLVWGAFAIGVSVAFLSVDSCYQATKDHARAAKVGGQIVTQETYRQLADQIQGFGRSRDESIPSALIASQVWRQVAAMQTASELKLSVSPSELQAVVQTEFVGAGGTFDPDLYTRSLSKAGTTPALYEEFLKNQLALRKLETVVETSAWVTPAELEDELSAWTDELTLRYATLSNRFVNAPLELTDSQLRAYYDEHRAEFRLPNQVAVRYVALPISNFISRISIPEDDIRAYYDDHTERFTRTTASNTTEALKLSEARPEILSILKIEAARQSAATNLLNDFAPLVAQSGAAGFARAAAAFHLPVRQSPLFGATEELPWIEAEKDFREAAFDLDASQAEGRYNVVRGETVVYAITTLTNSPAHLPAFEACIHRVRPPALAKARADAFQKQVSAVHADLLKATKAGTPFEAACRAEGMNVSTSMTFAAHTLSRTSFDNCLTVIQGAMRLRPGELSEPCPIRNGAIFVHLTARQPGDPLSAEMLRPQLRGNLARNRSSALFRAWMERNLADRGLEVAKTLADSISAKRSGDEE